MKQVNAFLTSDGTLFETKKAAENHQIILDKEILIDDFLNGPSNKYTGKPQQAIVRLTLINWELWKAKNDKVSD